MKKNFKCNKKEIEKKEVTHYGLKMAKYTLQALLGSAVAAVGFGVLGGPAEIIPISLGLSAVGISVGRMIKLYKEKEQANQTQKGGKKK